MVEEVVVRVETVSPRRQQALAELRAWREREDDPEILEAIDRCIAILLREDTPPT